MGLTVSLVAGNQSNNWFNIDYIENKKREGEE
jgi:hypothetical protein